MNASRTLFAYQLDLFLMTDGISFEGTPLPHDHRVSSFTFTSV
jgi:hypothetical protein